MKTAANPSKAVLAPGDYFGEDLVFTGAGEASTCVRALTPAEVYEVGQQVLAKLMKDRPSMVDEISVTPSPSCQGRGSRCRLVDGVILGILAGDTYPSALRGTRTFEAHLLSRQS